MISFMPFRAVRPATEYAEKVAALPYDVMTSEEARIMAGEKPLSFLHVDRAEINFPSGTDPYSPEVYAKAKEYMEKMVSEGVFLQEKRPRFFLYRLTMNGRSQTGIVGCASIDDYENGLIKKHEFTRADKEEDRVRHVDALDANTGPIFLACRKNARLAELLGAGGTPKAASSHSRLASRCAASPTIRKTTDAAAAYDFTCEDGVRHEVWVLDEDMNESVQGVFAGMEALYIADGHHRCASAVRVGKLRREQNPGWTGDEEFNFFLAVVFPEDQLEIMDYNRAVKDLNGLSEEAFLSKLGEFFEVAAYDGEGPVRPDLRHTFGMYLSGSWYVLRAKSGVVVENDPVKRLDVSVLQNYVLEPLLGILDPRTDKRIDFIGGIRGLEELERRVKADMKVAFALYPTAMQELFDIADAGLVMPPKSTWFEPKLRSGLFVHRLG